MHFALHDLPHLGHLGRRECVLEHRAHAVVVGRVGESLGLVVERDAHRPLSAAEHALRLRRPEVAVSELMNVTKNLGSRPDA